MIERTLTNPAEEIEARKINVLTERYCKNLGAFDIAQIGNTGFLLQSRRHPPIVNGDWFLFDFDDTLRGTTETKGKRSMLYRRYVRELGINVSDNVLEFIMNKTDVFSRWVDIGGEEDSYHINAHMSALDWSTNRLKYSSDKIPYEEIAIDAVNHLDRIKMQLQGKQASETADPFYFRKAKLVLRSFVPWSKGIEDIFTQSMINPPDYSETIDAVRYLSQPYENFQTANLGIFTYGDVYYQLLKVFEFMQQNPNIPVNQVWLAKIPKGRFIEKLAQVGSTLKTQLHYSQEDLDDNRDGSGSLEFPLGHIPCVIVILDDSIKELNSIQSTNDFVRRYTETSLVTIRSRRSGTKESEKEWDAKTSLRELDFRNKNLTASEIATVLQTNRHLNRRNN